MQLGGWVLCKIYKNKRQMDDENTKEVINKRHKGEIEDTREVTDSIQEVTNLDDMPNQHSQVSSLDGEGTKELMNKHQSEIEHNTIEAEDVTTLHCIPNQHSQDGQYLLMKRQFQWKRNNIC